MIIILENKKTNNKTATKTKIHWTWFNFCHKAGLTQMTSVYLNIYTLYILSSILPNSPPILSKIRIL